MSELIVIIAVVIIYFVRLKEKDINMTQRNKHNKKPQKNPYFRIRMRTQKHRPFNAANKKKQQQERHSKRRRKNVHRKNSTLQNTLVSP